MKLTQHTYTHAEKGFNIKILTAGKKLVTAENLDTKEVVKFNRAKLEWMICKKIFIKNEDLSEA